MSINTTINSTIIFTCEGVGDLLTVRVKFYGVNETKAATDTTVMERGFFVETSNDNGTRSAELQATAYEFNNNTNITCRVFDDQAANFSDSSTAILMIQG